MYASRDGNCNNFITFTESLDEMTRFVCNLFEKIVNMRVREPCWQEHPYGPQQLRRRVFAVPIMDVRRLELLWPCEDLHQWWESMVRHTLSLYRPLTVSLIAMLYHVVPCCTMLYHAVPCCTMPYGMYQLLTCSQSHVCFVWFRFERAYIMTII